ncbi:hypothetical protein Vafri_18733 [Volvox africanus]|uniref:Ubiquitin-related modifier 1 n=1 Tax=Volvox africanus TaxID=51714 RepID=A0A8J4BML5_9CHLO|nr:hypothetical protein Vafri_18733 [Volvox africanus]
MVRVHIEFSGGLELLFGNQKEHDVDVPVQDGNQGLTAGHLIAWARDNMLRERPELFMKGSTVYVPGPQTCLGVVALHKLIVSLPRSLHLPACMHAFMPNGFCYERDSNQVFCGRL